MTRILFPFAVIAEDDITAVCRFRVDDVEASNGQVECTPASRLHVAVETDGLAAACKETGLDRAAVLRLCLRLVASPSGCEIILGHRDFAVAGAPERVTLEGEVSAGRLGPAIRVETLLLLVTPGAPSNSLWPVEPGSVLWSHREDKELEGTRARFPTESVSFSSLGLRETSAMWRVVIDVSDLDRPLKGAIHVQLNTDRLPAEAALPDHEAAHLASYLMRTIIVTVLGAMAEDELLVEDSERKAMPKDSLRACAAGFLHGLDQTLTTQAWRRLVLEQPAQLELMTDHAARGRHP